MIRSRILGINNDLQSGILEPSEGDNINHILKIVCGKGSKEHGLCELKYLVPLQLVFYDFIEFYNNAKTGVIIVRF